MKELESALEALETCDRELNALTTSELALLSGPVKRRGEALARLTAILQTTVLRAGILEVTQALTVGDYERIRKSSRNGERVMEKLRASRDATCAEWSRLNQEKYLLGSMLNIALPAAAWVDFPA